MALVPLAVLIPLVGAGLVAATRPFAPRPFADIVTMSATVAVLVICLILMRRGAHHEVVYWFGGWRPHAGVALGISFSFGALGAGFAAFCAVLMVAALTFAWRFIENVDSLFHAVLLAFLAAAVGFCLSGDLFNMFVFFELMSIAAYVLAGFVIEQRAALEGSFNFAVTNSAGGILVLIGISLVYGRTGALNLAQIGSVLGRGHVDALVVAAFALIVCGFGVKAAIVPFHFWLADAYAVAPTPVCILFAGAMSELGLYGIGRVYWTCFHGALGAHDSSLRAVLVGAGLVTAIVGAVMAVAQRHLKRLLAFVTIAFIGLFTIGFGLLTAEGVAGVAAFVAGDGFVKAALFVAVGIVQYRLAGVEEHDLHGAGRHLRLVGATFLVGALATAGLPPFGPFLGHSMIAEAAARLPGYGWLPAAMMVVSAIAAGALLAAAARVFLGLGRRPPRKRSRETGESESRAHDHTPATLWIPTVLLLAAGLAWGLIPGLPESLTRAAAHFTDHAGYIADVLGRGAPPLAPTRAATPSTASYLYGFGAVAGALAIAALAVADERLPRLRRAAAGSIGWLRALHSGRIGDYVAWLTAGTALTGGLFAIALR